MGSLKKLDNLKLRKSARDQWGQSVSASVWYGFWSDGVIRPYFFENEIADVMTVIGTHYRNMVTEFLWPQVDGIFLNDMWFSRTILSVALRMNQSICWSNDFKTKYPSNVIRGIFFFGSMRLISNRATFVEGKGLLSEPFRRFVRCFIPCLIRTCILHNPIKISHSKLRILMLKNYALYTQN